MGLRRFAGVVAAVAAAAPGAYLVIYLFRWEWHRAIVAGLLFVAAEVALAAGMILRRLTGLAARLDRIEGGGAPSEALPAVLAHVRAAAPPPVNRFAWLEPDRTNVFLPILLGAGVLASALAWVVEGVSRATARPALERRLALRLATLSPPAGGLLVPVTADPPGMAVRQPWGLRLLAIPLAALFGAAGIDALADASQSRPDAHRPEVATAIDLQLVGSRAVRNPQAQVQHLWGLCASIVARAPAPQIYGLGGAMVRLELATDVGLHARRKLHGCLEDANLDGVQARVAAIRTVPEAAPAGGPGATSEP